MATFGSFDTTEENNDSVLDASTYKVPEVAKTETDALEQIQTEEFYKTLKSYYSYREDDKKFNKMSHADLLEYFYTDRSWRTNNTVSMGMDLSNVMNEDDEQRLKEFAYISQTYENMPSFWNDPNRSFGAWLVDNGSAMIADPVNLVGMGVGGQAAKTAYKQALRVTIKDKIAGEINEQALKETAKYANKQALGKAVIKGGLVEGGINTVIAGGQDALLQHTNIEAGIQDKYSVGRSAIASAAGFGFGTAFGSVFAAGAFKLTNNAMRRKSVKQLLEIEAKGRSTMTGSQLFDVLVPDNNTSSLKIKPTPKTTKEYINDLNRGKITPEDKPPLKSNNATKFKNPSSDQKQSNEGLIKFTIDETTDKLKKGTITHEQMINDAVRLFGADPKKLTEFAERVAYGEDFVNLYATMVAQKDKIKAKYDIMGALGTESNRLDLTPNEKLQLIADFDKKMAETSTELMIDSVMGTNVARGLNARNIDADGTRAAKLMTEPENPKMLELAKGTPEQKWEFMNAVGKLSDRDQIIRALQNVRKVNNWELGMEFVNNNLLSSPDTHILNIVSGLVQTQWKPATMFLRGLNMTLTDKDRARVIMREALQTYLYQYAFLGHALKRAGKSFWEGRAILDSRQMKHDSNVRQGQLQDLFDAWGEAVTDIIGLEGTKIGKAVTQSFRGAGRVITAPMRVLSAGDEFLKSMMFKARMTSLINSKILQENPEFDNKFYKFSKDRKLGLTDITYADKYKKRAKEIEAEYIRENGSAIEIGQTVNDRLNSPLYHAQEGSYTPSAGQINPNTGKLEDKLTGTILRTATKHKSLRLLGLHFINTPSNLLRWSAQHLPFLGRFQFQMGHMLAEKGLKSGKFRSEIARGLNPFRKKEYLNPEAAAEAKARIQMGWALWGTAVNFALAGKIVGGGDVEWKKQRDKEQNTGEIPYSYKTDDGRYISLNRLDPLMMPFFIAADLVSLFKGRLSNTDDLDPVVEKDATELIMGTVATLTRNVTSKFYTKNLIELVHLMTSDDVMFSRKPEKMATNVASQFAFKVFPLSGGLRYLDRVNDEWERELYTLSDRLKSLNPMDSKTAIMPRRNMFGEPIERKNGWLFGLGGESGLWSSPFAMTNFKNTETAKFIRERDFKYKHPLQTIKIKGDSTGGMNLKDIRNSKNQTAYDRMLEIKNNTVVDESGSIIYDKSYDGTHYTMAEYVEKMILDKNSEIYMHPKGTINGKDEQAQVIIDFVKRIDRYSKQQMMSEFPEFAQRQKDVYENKDNKYRKHYETLETLAQ
jgi:hypothetical protein